MQRLKVLVVSQYFWPESFRINEVVEALIQRGCQVTVLTGQPNYPEGKVYPGYRAFSTVEEQHESGARIVRIPLLPRSSGSGLRLALNYLSFVFSGLVIAPWKLRQDTFDVIFVYAISPVTQVIPAILLRRLKRSALVVWVQDLWPESLEVTGFVRNRTVLGLVAAMTRWIYRRSDRLLVQSKAFIAPVETMAGGTPVAYHPNPGDASRPGAVATPAATLAPGFNVVFAGNMGTAQSPETIVRAAFALQDLKDLRFVIIGGGSRLEWLREEARRLGLANMDFMGRFQAEQMIPILRQASALLITLGSGDILTRTIPSKLGTYLAVGRPIVGALDGEGADVIASARAGVSCPAEDADGLAAAIRSVYHLPDEDRLAMGASGQQYFSDHFEPGRLAGNLVDQFRIAINEAGFNT